MILIIVVKIMVSNICTDPVTKFQPIRSRSDHNLIRTESSKRSKELEYELSMADERKVFEFFKCQYSLGINLSV